MQNKIFPAFWIFGLINNVLYVVILSAAADLVGPLVPKATVLAADIIPAFIFKLVAPFFVHLIPYTTRIFCLVLLSTVGMIIIASSSNSSSSISLTLFGIVLASLSSGLGELTFLQLTHYYGDSSITGWSSGTGGAGLVGSFAYLFLTTWLGLDVKIALFLFCIVPTVILLNYFYYLPKSNNVISTGLPQHHSLATNEHSNDSARFLIPHTPGTGSDSTTPSSFTDGDDTGDDIEINSYSSVTEVSYKDYMNSGKLKTHIKITLNRLKPLVLPYMLPLLTVYLGEYVINQGISPTLLFPIEELPFKQYRDAYVTYGTLYQLGVFVSRSSGSFIRINNLYMPAVLQILNCIICILQALYVIFPNIYILFLLMFYEGLLGGAAYVNTFMLLREQVSPTEREFALGAVGISDSAGIVIAAIISIQIEPRLCQYQVDDGRPYCRLH
ncbi:unnamed protein product [[Candida] boidinii]|uniref:Protein BTN n=1 Tax=Candida boidinii TaxID=5477 RepID=A0A9W6SVT8_CANBO|nr:hypothetical protein B5S30_g2338 [[Candida] boidinii]OWB83335.1 hypothetical protein B5S33_g1964 [[Candida] boidinii]GME67126.1 unnamed protein product [[Candida] boidinii]